MRRSYISTHTPHTECDYKGNTQISLFDTISTHTPHTECDSTYKIVFDEFQQSPDFNSHTPHGVRRPLRTLNRLQGRFQLTHPTRSATGNTRLFSRPHHYFNSHTPHGVRQKKLAELESVQKISTHTPHTECDIKNPRPVLAAPNISTHTPHTECDCSPNSKKDLYTRFQLTHPTRSATL